MEAFVDLLKSQAFGFDICEVDHNCHEDIPDNADDVKAIESSLVKSIQRFSECRLTATQALLGL